MSLEIVRDILMDIWLLPTYCTTSLIRREGGFLRPLCPILQCVTEIPSQLFNILSWPILSPNKGDEKYGKETDKELTLFPHTRNFSLDLISATGQWTINIKPVLWFGNI